MLGGTHIHGAIPILISSHITGSCLEAYVQNECVFAKNIMENSLLEVKDNYHANSLYTVRMFDNVYN